MEDEHMIRMNGMKRDEDWKKYMREQNRKWAIKLTFVIVAIALLFALLLQAGEKVESGEKKFVLQKYLQDRDYLIYGAHNYAPPLRFVDSDGVYKGVSVDYMSQLALELGVEIRTEPYSWEKALENLKEGKTDFCDMFASNERAKDYVFSDPFYNIRVALVVRADSKFTFDDINKMRIATESGDYSNNYMKENFPQAELVYVADVNAGMELLAANAVDAVIGDEPIVLYCISKLDSLADFRIINTALYEEPVVLGMPKSHADLVPIINNAIREINNQGQLEKIQQKWFGISTPLIQAEVEKPYIHMVQIGGLILLTIISIITLNNNSLKKLVQRRTRELESNRNELQLIFDSIPECILILDEEKRILNANQGALQYTGLSVEDGIGQPISAFWDKFQREHAEKAFEDSLGLNGEKQTFKSGKDVYELQTYRMTDDDMGILLTLRNITLDEINRKQLLSSSKMLAVGQLAAGMAHQIRNPLSIIRMHTYLLKENVQIDEAGQKSLRYIDENAQKAAGIISNVLNFWHVSGDQLETVNLRQCLKSIMELHENPIKHKSIEAEIRCEETLTFVGNAESLKHILVNLVSNAVDAMEIGGKLLLSGEVHEKEIFICCQDNGTGIAEKHLENLFNPFFTTKDPGKGTGLGLFVVYSEVEKLSGEIRVESKENEGTCFTICLPMREEARYGEEL